MTSAFVMIQIGNATDMKSIHAALHAIPGVKSVHFLAGPTDVIAFVDVADQAGMMDAIGKIRAVKGVASTDTRIVVPV
jgi:DNA-binding Lrp family transcriptional regulator